MPRKKYVKRDPEFPVDGQVTEEVAEVPAPVAPPNPAVLALQGDIVILVRARQDVRALVVAAQENLMRAQAEFQITQSKMGALEQEVQYLHSQVAQLEGRPPTPQMPFVVPQQQGGFPRDLSNISSAPTMPDDGVRRAHADQLRAAL